MNIPKKKIDSMANPIIRKWRQLIPNNVFIPKSINMAQVPNMRIKRMNPPSIARMTKLSQKDNFLGLFFIISLLSDNENIIDEIIGSVNFFYLLKRKRRKRDRRRSLAIQISKM
jgi:hypothetical protein